MNPAFHKYLRYVIRLAFVVWWLLPIWLLFAGISLLIEYSVYGRYCRDDAVSAWAITKALVLP